MEIIEIAKNCTVDGNTLHLPKIELSREDYLAVKKVFESYGGKWKGGKICGFVFADNNASDVVESIINGGSTNKKKDFQFYATPDWVADMMAQDLDIHPSDRVLEPSAGSGSLVNAVHRIFPEIEIDCYELDGVNRKFLEIMPNTKVIGEDFIKRNDLEEYNVIIGNPPFSKNQDIIHLMKMYNNLKPGGRIGCLTSTHWTFANDAKSKLFREWLEGKCVHQTELPSGTFKGSGTNVATIYLIIKKP